MTKRKRSAFIYLTNAQLARLMRERNPIIQPGGG